MTSYPAQIVFIEDDSGRRWVGRLLNPRAAIDTATGKPAQEPRFIITEAPLGGYLASMQGNRNHPGGRRYRTFKSLTDAQSAGIRWAARRFEVVV